MLKNKILLFMFLLFLCLSVVVITIKFIPKSKDIDVVKTINDYSESSIVLDKNTKRILYENNIHKKMLPASTTKILTCITVIENYNLDDLVLITKDMLNVDGSSIYLEIGDVISVKDLLYGLMLCSGNDAASALSYHYSGNQDDFIYLMNELAKKIGMKNSIFENPHGLDSTSKNYTTVYDMALLMSYALDNDIFREITKTKVYNPKIASGKQMYFTNKHRLIKTESNVTGGKTGFTKMARRTLVTSFKEGDFEIVVVTFNSTDDFNFHRLISRNIFDKYNYKTIFNKTKLNLTLKETINFEITKNDLKAPILEDEKIKYQINKSETLIEVVFYFEDGQITKKWFEVKDE